MEIEPVVAAAPKVQEVARVGPGKEEAFVVEILRSQSDCLAFLNEIVRPRLLSAVGEGLPELPIESIHATFYYLLEHAVESRSLLESFSKLFGQMVTNMKFYAVQLVPYIARVREVEKNAEVVQLFSGPQAKEAGCSSFTSVVSLLLLPLAHLFMWSNFLHRLAVSGAESKEAMESFAKEIDGIITSLCFIDEELQNHVDSQHQVRKLDGELSVEKKGFFVDLLRKNKVPPKMSASPTRLFFGKLDLQAVFPKDPSYIRDVRLFVFNDVVLLTTRTQQVIQTMQTREIVVSERHELAGPRSDACFSLFWNKGSGKLSHIVFLAENEAAAEAALLKLHLSVRRKLNESNTKNLFLVRERKVGHGRNNEYGVQYHFMIWGFGRHAMYRYCPDTGRGVAFYKARELQSFREVITAEREHRVRISLDEETFELSSYGLGQMILFLENILAYKIESDLAKHRRKQDNPWTLDADDVAFLKPEQLAARKAFADEIQKETEARLREAMEPRVLEIQKAYNALSYELYQREVQVRELETKAAAQAAPSIEQLEKRMTHLERQQNEDARQRAAERTRQQQQQSQQKQQQPPPQQRLVPSSALKAKTEELESSSVELVTVEDEDEDEETEEE